MNKLFIRSDNIVNEMKSNVEINVTDKINIIPHEDTSIYLLLENVDKIINIDIPSNLSVVIHEDVSGSTEQTIYYKVMGQVSINRFNHGEDSTKTTIDLNAPYAKADFRLSSLAKKKQTEVITINHYQGGSASNLVAHGLAEVNSALKYHFTIFVPKGAKDCLVNQDSKILTNDETLCEIKPILLIDEEAVTARHASSMGSYSETEIFYLMSRGIPYQECLKLLQLGFLLNNIPSPLKETILENIK